MIYFLVVEFEKKAGMKIGFEKLKFYWVIIICCWIGNVSGQEIPERDSMVFEVNDSILLDNKRNITTRWFLLDMGWNMFFRTYSNVPDSYYDSLALKTAGSMHWGINVFRQRINLKRHRLNLEYGFTLDLDRYAFSSSVSLSPYSDVVTPIPVDTVELKKNRLHMTSISVPILLQYESNPLRMKKSFHVSAGGYVGFVMGTKLKQKTSEGEKSNVKGNFNLSNILYGVRTEIGFGYVSVFVKYGIHPFFIKNQDSGFGLQSMTMGIRLIPFF